MTTKIKTMIAAAFMGSVVLGASAQSYINETSLVGTDKDAWHGSGTYGVMVTPAGGSEVNMVEFYTSNSNELTVDFTPLYQNVENLTDGKYRLTIYATANHAWGVCGDNGLSEGATSTTANEIFATSGDNSYSVAMTSGAETAYTTPGKYTISPWASSSSKHRAPTGIPSRLHRSNVWQATPKQ